MQVSHSVQLEGISYVVVTSLDSLSGDVRTTRACMEPRSGRGILCSCTCLFCSSLLAVIKQNSYGMMLQYPKYMHVCVLVQTTIVVVRNKRKHGYMLDIDLKFKGEHLTHANLVLVFFLAWIMQSRSHFATRS